MATKTYTTSSTCMNTHEKDTQSVSGKYVVQYSVGSKF